MEKQIGLLALYQRLSQWIKQTSVQPGKSYRLNTLGDSSVNIGLVQLITVPDEFIIEIGSNI